MKRINLIIVMFVCSVFCYSQTLRFGIKGGMNITNESSHKNSDVVLNSSKDRVGFNAGGVACLPVSDKLEAEIDLLYSEQGYKDYLYITKSSNRDDDLERKTYTITSRYLNCPVTLKYTVINHLYLECGPQFGFLLSKNNSFKGFYDTKEYKRAKFFDFGVVAGLGYNISRHLFVNARYSFGFTGTSKMYDGGRNKNIQIDLGYLF